MKTKVGYSRHLDLLGPSPVGCLWGGSQIVRGGCVWLICHARPTFGFRVERHGGADCGLRGVRGSLGSGRRTNSCAVSVICYLFFVLRQTFCWDICFCGIKRDISSHVYVSDSPQVGVFAEKGVTLWSNSLPPPCFHCMDPRGSILWFLSSMWTCRTLSCMWGPKVVAPVRIFWRGTALSFTRLPLGMKGGSTQRHGCI